MERKNTELTINSKNQIIDLDGCVLCKTDFVASKPIIPRHYDYTTTNTSFLNMHVLLKKMGVKNHNEHLQIFNKDLVGIDPHSPTLTDDQKLAIDIECRINPWYYFREVVRITVSGNKVPYRLGLEGYTTLWLMLRCINTLLETPRQVGKTTTVEAVGGSWVLIFSGTDVKMGNMHYESEMAKKNLSRLSDVLDNLPPYLQYHKKVVSKPDKDGNISVKDVARTAAKKESIPVPVFNNIIENYVVGKSPDEARNTGRGATIPVWIIDELAHIKYNDIAFTSFVPAYSEASIAARRNGNIYGLWAMCTPGDLKTEFGQWVRKQIDKNYLKFGPEHFQMFDMTKLQVEDYINKRARQNTVFISYTFDLLGYSEKWLSTKAKGSELKAIRTEFLLKWEVQTDKSPFSTAVLSKLETLSNINENRIKEFKLTEEDIIYYYPKDTDICHDFNTFLMNYPGGIVMGSDISFGVGGESDSTTLVGVDPKTLRVLFIYKSNTIAVDDYAILLLRIFRNHFDTTGVPAALAIERNSNGRSLIHILKRHSDLVRYLVVYLVSESRMKSELEVDFNFNYNGVNSKFDIGLNIDSNTRSELMNLLFQLVAKHTDAIAYKHIIEELKSLVYVTDKSGRTKIEHASGKHDDVVFGLMHAMYAIFRNADLLQKRNNILVEPDSFIISENKQVINSVGRHKVRIQNELVSKDGKLVERYYDTYTRRYISAEAAHELELEARQDALLTNDKKDVTVVEDINKEHLDNLASVNNRYEESEIVKVNIQGESVYDRKDYTIDEKESRNILFDQLFNL